MVPRFGSRLTVHGGFESATSHPGTSNREPNLRTVNRTRNPAPRNPEPPLSSAERLDAAHLPQAGIAGVRHANRRHADLSRALEGDIAPRDAWRVGHTLSAPIDRRGRERALGCPRQLQIVGARG